MKKLLVSAVFSFFAVFAAASAQADLDGFMADLNIQARANLDSFSMKLGVQFGIPSVRVQAIINSVDAPADAFMCLQLGQMTNRPPETVVRTYQRNKKKGWGTIAKQLGIKPGSAEFHALKRGDFSFTGEPGRKSDDKPGKGKGHGRGHNK